MTLGRAISIRLSGRDLVVAPGAVVDAAESDVYRDAPDKLLAAIAAEISDGVPWREAAARHLAARRPWLHRIVTDPARTLWLDRNPPRAGSLVLDVGAGWGQWTLPAARRARVVALEPNRTRLATLRAMLHQEQCDGNTYFVAASLAAVEFPDVFFDSVYCIGVLEWLPRYQAAGDPRAVQLAALAKMRRLLAPNGECIIGIENRMGLKYLLGAPDDHLGIPGISCFDAALAGRRYAERTGQSLRVFTYSEVEYRELCHEAGFAQVDFFSAFPDYKVPLVITAAGEETDRACRAGAPAPEHSGSDGRPLAFQDELSSHYRTLATLGVASKFAPSFFIRART